MDMIISFVFLIIGLAIGAVVMYFVQKLRQVPEEHAIEKALQIQKAELTGEHQNELSRLRLQQSEEIKLARKESVNRSRSVLKGKVAEQMAPLLPGFEYLPSDARFIGDPIDYIIFNGYTSVKDDRVNEDNLEVVIADIKQGKSGLSAHQRAIARAIEEGRVRFEVIRIQDDGTITSRAWRSRS